MKNILIQLSILFSPLMVFSQNYILIDKRSGKDTAFVDTVRMPVYLAASEINDFSRDPTNTSICFAVCDTLESVNMANRLTVPEYFIPLDYINPEYTIGRYLEKYLTSDQKTDSILFFVNFSSYFIESKAYFESISNIPALKELDKILNDTSLFSLLPQAKEYEIKNINEAYGPKFHLSRIIHQFHILNPVIFR